MWPSLFIIAASLAAAPAPAGRSVAVFPLVPLIGVSAPAAQLLSETLVEEVRATHVFAPVMSPREIAALMPSEQQKFLLRCASEDCAVVDNELAGVLGVSHIMTGTAGRLGEVFLITLKLHEVRSGLTVASMQHQGRGTGEEAIIPLLAPAVARLFAQAQLQPLAAASAKPGSSAPGSESGAAVRVSTLLRGGGTAALVIGAASVLPAFVAAALAGGWVATAYQVAAVRALVPVPGTERTQRFYGQLLGPAAGAGVLGVMTVVLGVLVGGVGVALLVASMVAG